MTRNEDIIAGSTILCEEIRNISRIGLYRVKDRIDTRILITDDQNNEIIISEEGFLDLISDYILDMKKTGISKNVLKKFKKVRIF